MIRTALLSCALLYAACCSAASQDWSVLVPRVIPAAVHIDAYLPNPGASAMWQIPGVRHSWITDLFDKLRSRIESDAPAGAPAESRSEGAGYFYGPRGKILTARHVIDGASRVLVTLADGRQMKARIVGEDSASDIAVLDVSGTGPFVTLPAVPMDQVLVGEAVLAIGSPLGFAHSVSAGIISAKREDNVWARDIFLQTDTPLTHGSSGGVLVDSKGRAVGISTYGHPGSFVSFLVPAERATQVAAYLERGERPPRTCESITARTHT